MLRTCAAWCAAIQAVPTLWPEAVLHGPNLPLDDWSWYQSVHFDKLEETMTDMEAESEAVVERAAALDAFTWRVRVTGCRGQVRLRQVCAPA